MTDERARKQNVLASLAAARERGDNIFVVCAFCGSDLRTCACADAKAHDEAAATKIRNPRVRACADRLTARRYAS
ncbi:hypothetical protein LCGC14_1181780 [marine sediment metagenome]|uniref:Uncharacterized protein n=1 Tax=marine sediment metagenome TaxID=412755 RepID=A0A0F9M9M7_9ZZZZ